MAARLARQLGPWPSLAAWLLGGAVPPPAPGALDAQAGEALAFLRRFRVAAECAAGARALDPALPALVRRGLAVERERTRHEAERRAPFLRLAGESLARSGVRAMLLKGGAVVELTHGDPSRRPMVDLDVLVAPGARRPARAALLEAGFEATTFDSPLHDVLVHAGRGSGAGQHALAIEVHVDVVAPPHPFELGLPGVLERAGPSRQPGLLVPERADALVLTAVQLMAHETDGTKTLSGLRDLALLALHGERVAEPFELARAVTGRADAAGVALLVGSLGRRAEAWAGGPAWLSALGRSGSSARTGWRRRAALSLALAEADRLLAAGSPGPRVLGRRLLAAAWHARILDALRAGWRGLAGSAGDRGVPQSMAVFARHAAATLRLLVGRQP